MLLKASKETMLALMKYQAAKQDKNEPESLSYAVEVAWAVISDLDGGPHRDWLASECTPVQIVLKPGTLALLHTYQATRAMASTLPNDAAIAGWYRKGRQEAAAFVEAFLGQLTYRQSQLLVSRYQDCWYRNRWRTATDLTDAERSAIYDDWQFWNNKDTFLSCLAYGSFEDERLQSPVAQGRA